MTDLLAVLNHLLGAWLQQARPEGRGWRVGEVRLEPDGFRLSGELTPPLGEGSWVLRGRLEAPSGPRHRLRLRLERVPERLAPGAEPFRGLLESARATLDVSFEEEGWIEP